MNLIDQYIDDLPDGAVLDLCDRYGIEHHEAGWLTSDWPDRMNEIRNKLAEKIMGD